MEPVCYIVGAMDPGPLRFPRPGLIIAADGGYAHLRGQGLAPDIAVGDFDSLGYIPEKNVVRHPPEKDDTDTMLAIRLGLERDYGVFVLYGCLGGRLDHTYANLQVLLYLARRGAAGFLLGEGTAVSAVHCGRLDFAPGHAGTISVFCPDGEARGVSLTGLCYPLRDAVLTSAFPLGVSNRFTGQAASAEVKEGTLLVMWDHPEGILPEQSI